MTGNELIKHIEKHNLYDCDIFREDGTLIGYLNTDQAAEKLGVTDIAIRQWIRRGKLPKAVKFGKEWYIPEDQEYTGRIQSTKSADIYSNQLITLINQDNFRDIFIRKFEDELNGRDFYFDGYDVINAQTSKYITEIGEYTTYEDLTLFLLRYFDLR